MKAHVETITPEQATRLLEESKTINRKFNIWNKKALINAMQSGEFRCTGQPIILDEEDDIVDGHHRLIACAESGVTIQTLVVRGAQSSNFHLIDIGARRSMGNILQINGNKNACLLSAVINLVYVYALGKQPAGSERMSPDRILAFVNNNAMVEVAVRYSDTKKRSIMPKSATGALAFLASMACRKDGHSEELSPFVVEFLDSVHLGQNLGPKTPEYFLNRCLVNIVMSKKRTPTIATYEAMIRAWNAKIEGREYGTGIKILNSLPLVSGPAGKKVPRVEALSLFSLNGGHES